MTTITNPSFKEYLWKEKSNRSILILALFAMVIQFSIFKYFYPNAGFIDGDSYVYLDTAFWNKGINTYMIGYSMFLRFFSVFSTSDFALVAFQYLFIELGALLLVFTLCYFFQPVKVIKYIMLAFAVINPLFLYMANYVSSDGFFLALSFTWFSSLMWLLQRPSHKLIFYHTILLFICFTVRYNALMYPFISLAVILFSTVRTKVKMQCIALILLLVGGFVLYNGNKYEQLTGHWQYSPFGGWQLANNAMYAYKYVDSAQRKPVPPQFVTLDNMIRKYFDTATNPFTHPEILLKASTVYMWDPRSPLYKYRNTLFTKDSSASELKKWASMGPFYSQYGLYIISHYPGHYLQYFIWPNACKYYALPVEFLEQYNSGEDSVKPPAMQWFKYKNPKRIVRLKDLHVTVLNYYPILTGIVNVLFLFILLCLMSLGFFRNKTPLRNAILLITIFWLANAAFTILSSSAALRFQAFPAVLTTLVVLAAIDQMVKTAKLQEQQKKINQPFIISQVMKRSM